MDIKQYDAVIFDLDGTLIDSMWVWYKIDEEFLGSRNIAVPQNLNKEIEGMSFTETAHYFKKRFELDMDIETIKEVWMKMAWDLYTNEVPLKEGVKEFLESLKLNNIKIGIASSNSRELIYAILDAHGIREYFEQIKTSCEVGRGKPYPDIYLKVAEELNVEPQRCLVFEDIPNGVRAGKNAGMTVWCVADRQDDELWEEAKSVADNHINNYFEVIKQLSL